MNTRVRNSLLWLVPAGSVGLGAVLFHLLGRDGLTIADWLLCACCALVAPGAILDLLCLILVPFLARCGPRIPCLPALPNPAPRIGIIVPVHEEDMADVMNRLAATWTSLVQDAPASARTTRFHVLSDSGPDRENEERQTVATWVGHTDIPVSYRRRVERTNAKAGNVYEFLCSPVAEDLDFIIGFDADSVMSGQAISRLIRVLLHPDNADVAIVQAPIQIRAARTLIGLVEAWSRRHLGGLACQVLQKMLGGWSYYGHNYAARTGAMRPACGRLLAQEVRCRFPGLNGYVASHDLAEAVVLSEYRYRVIHDDVNCGSYEEMPETFAQYAARDSRWLRGSLQHIAAGWVFRGRCPQRFVLTTAAWQYVTCLPSILGVLCLLALTIRSDVLLGTTTPYWNAGLHTVQWAYTTLPSCLLLLTLFSCLVPSLAALLWNVFCPRGRRPGTAKAAGQILSHLPEFVILHLYGFLVSPLITVLRFRAVFGLLFCSWSWRTYRADRTSYGIVAAINDLWPVWLLGVAILLVGVGQPWPAPWCLAFVGLPMVCAPLTAVLISSPGVARLVRRIGLFNEDAEDLMPYFAAVAGNGPEPREPRKSPPSNRVKSLPCVAKTCYPLATGAVGNCRGLSGKVVPPEGDLLTSRRAFDEQSAVRDPAARAVHRSM